jgi:hypothetical protein
MVTLPSDKTTPAAEPEEEADGLEELMRAAGSPRSGYASPLIPPNRVTQESSPLTAAHDKAVEEIERQRERPGQLSTGINGDVGDSILTAGKLALEAFGDRHVEQGVIPNQFVVAAPPGTGKTSHAVALMAASVSIADDDLTKPFGCVFVVDQIMKADDMYRQIFALLPEQVAIWTSDHDVDCRQPIKVKSPAKQFHVDDLRRYPIVVVTQAFYRGPRGDKARSLRLDGREVPRALTIFDEQTKEVEVYDIRVSQAYKVVEAGERDKKWAPILKLRMHPLLRFMSRKAHEINAVPLETPTHDPFGWETARELEWFTTDTAEQFVRSNSRDIEYLEEVFGFAAQMARNCAFIFRRGGGENGTHFVAYVPVPTPSGSSVLLDATADIDGVTALCSWRKHMPVPRVRYDNLHIIHAEPYSRANLTDRLRSETERQRYAEHAKQLIKEIMPPGARGLVVCKKSLVDQRNLPDWSPDDPRFSHPEDFTTNFGWDLDGRQLAITYWGGHGIGANDWKDAEYVFQFGEHFLPRRTLIATVQGLLKATATEGILPSMRSANTNLSDLALIERGHLLRLMKQMGMRGKARAFDRHGVCGKQVLVLTCDLERLLAYADELFPGATLSKWGRTPDYFEHLSQPEMLMEILSDPCEVESISGDEIAKRMGAQDWRSISSNTLTNTIKQKVLKNLGWTYATKRGPGGGSRFHKCPDNVLHPRLWDSQNLISDVA